MILRTALILLFGLTLPLSAPLSANAHEFWIEPFEYRVGADQNIVADAINGEDFNGNKFSYSARAFQRSGIAAGATTLPIGGKNGARPAITVKPAGPGLNILFHASPMEQITYDTIEDFETFLVGKELEAALETHRAKGYPEEKIKEAYFRFVKALVQVGNGSGRDKPVGMPWELVALDNPYISDGDIRFGLLQGGKTVADAPVYYFRKTDAGVEKTTLRTDAKGQFVVPRQKGAFMVNAVHISEPRADLKEQTGALWQTLWASVTYKID